MKACSYCKENKDKTRFSINSKKTKQLDSICKECRKNIAKIKREAINLEKYYKRIKENGYFIKICDVHGGLAYEDIHLRVKRNPNPNQQPLWVELICKKCTTKTNQSNYNNEERYLERLKKLKIKCNYCKLEVNTKGYTISGLKMKYPRCQSCANDLGKKSFYKRRLFNRYGLTNEEYEDLHIQQNNLCMICKQQNKSKNPLKLNKLYVDHCHKTNKVRSLLCQQCNSGLGMFMDSPKLLRKAADYLDFHNENP